MSYKKLWIALGIVMADCDRLSTPNQFAAAASEATPPAKCIFGRSAIGRAVPAFHRLNCNTIADLEWTANQRSTKRRLCSSQQLFIARNPKAQIFQMSAKSIDRS